MKEIISSAIKTIAMAISTEVLKNAAEAFLDEIENAIQESKTKTDDLIVLPLIKTIREIIKVNDND